MKKNDYTFSNNPRRSQRRRREGSFGSGPGYRKARLSERQRQKRRRLISFILIAGVVAATLVFVGVFLLVRGRASSADTAGPPSGDSPGTVIMTGIDDSGRLSQLAVLAPEGQGGFSLYTIPPRTIADTPGYGFQQLDRVPELGGQELLDQTVANLLKLPIQYHVRFTYPDLETAVGPAGTVNFKTDRARNLAGPEGPIQLTVGDNAASPQLAMAILKASVTDGQDGPQVQSLFYQGLRDALSVKPEADRRNMARLLAGRVKTDMDEEKFVDLFTAATAAPGSFSCWPLPASLGGSGDRWFLEPVPAEIEALVTGGSEDKAFNLEIRNGTEQPGVVEAAAERLAPLRYNTTTQTAPTGVDFDETQIRVGSEALTAGNRVLNLLGKGSIIKDEYMEKRQIIVIMGKDLSLADLEKR